MDELKFINYLKRNIKHGKDVIYGIGDDAAVLNFTRDKYMLFASDMLIEGMHFKKNANPEHIGRKAVCVNISDIAAMGGIPKYCTISIGAPSIKIIKKVIAGSKKAAKRFGFQIVGGDTNKSKKIVIDVAIIGEVEKRFLTLRSGAKRGDLIFVTGSLGEGRSKHLTFTPRLKEARTLVESFKINSMIDISDGLFLDLYRLAEASHVGAFIYKSLIPLSENVKSIEDAVSYGEDFELLFTLSINEAKKLIRYMGRHEYPPVTLIGEIVSRGKGLNFVGDEGKVSKIRPRGYQHFR